MIGVTLAQVVVVSEHRYAALPAELAGSLVLAVADALASLSLRVEPQELLLLEDGTVRVCGGVPTDEASAELALRNLLDRILLGSCSVTPALLRAARRPCQGRVTVLVRELEVALIPTNRGAARRALARLCREVKQSMLADPDLQQEADCLQFTYLATVRSAASASVTPVPVAIAEPEIVEEWIEVSPICPEVIYDAVKFASAHLPARPDPSIDIPDLEIPNAATRQTLQDSPDWQPVEHTQKLNPVRTSASRLVGDASVPGLPPSTFPKPPEIPILADEMDPEIVELSDDDLHEVTAELPLSSGCDSPAILAVTPNSTAVASNMLVEYQTAEPFLLVLPSLGQETREEPSAAVLSCSELTQTSDAATTEPCMGEVDDTVLDAVTFIDEEKPASFQAQQGPSMSELDTAAAGPHTYAAPARFSATPSNVSDLIAQFSVAKSSSPDELTRGLRNLAGVCHESTSEPTATPPPTVCATTQAQSDPVPSGAFVRTLIGLGATGLFIVAAHMASGKIASAPAAANFTPISSSGSLCKAMLKISDAPLGTTIHVSQYGSNAVSEFVKVSHLPFQIDGLHCGEPAELLVKLSDRGWYRIPIEGNRLSANGNSEPVRIAEYVRPQME